MLSSRTTKLWECGNVSFLVNCTTDLQKMFLLFTVFVLRGLLCHQTHPKTAMGLHRPFPPFPIPSYHTPYNSKWFHQFVPPSRGRPHPLPFHFLGNHPQLSYLIYPLPLPCVLQSQLRSLISSIPVISIRISLVKSINQHTYL